MTANPGLCCSVRFALPSLAHNIAPSWSTLANRKRVRISHKKASFTAVVNTPELGVPQTSNASENVLYLSLNGGGMDIIACCSQSTITACLTFATTSCAVAFDRSSGLNCAKKLSPGYSPRRQWQR